MLDTKGGDEQVMVARLERLESSRLWAGVLMALMFAPVFFQLDGQFYTDPATLAAPRGAVTNLPIPLSVPACVLAVGLLFPLWWRDRLALLIITVVPLMIVASVVAAGGGTFSAAKAKLLAFQFAVPLAGFIIGRRWGRQEALQFHSISLWLLMLTIAIAAGHLLTSWLHDGTAVLAGHIFGVGVYGHLQYVPAIILAVGLFGLFAAWGDSDAPRPRTVWVAFVVLVVALYAAASMSMTAILGLWLGLGVLVISPIARQRRLAAAAMLVLAVVISSAYVVVATSRVTVFRSKFLGLGQGPVVGSAPGITTTPIDGRTASVSGQAASPHPAQGASSPAASPSSTQKADDRMMFRNVSERMFYWKFFAAATVATWPTFLFGHAEQPDIRLYPSAHNYYLDFLYNFGAIAMLPLLMMLGWTLRMSWRSRQAVGQSAALFGLAFATIFLLVVDNGLKPSMRQPYPGIATFFLWGALVSQLERQQAPERSAVRRTDGAAAAAVAPQ